MKCRGGQFQNHKFSRVFRVDKGIEVIKATSAVHVRSDQVLYYNWSPGSVMGTWGSSPQLSSFPTQWMPWPFSLGGRCGECWRSSVEKVVNWTLFLLLVGEWRDSVGIGLPLREPTQLRGESVTEARQLGLLEREPVLSGPMSITVVVVWESCWTGLPGTLITSSASVPSHTQSCLWPVGSWPWEGGFLCLNLTTYETQFTRKTRMARQKTPNKAYMPISKSVRGLFAKTSSPPISISVVPCPGVSTLVGKLLEFTRFLGTFTVLVKLTLLISSTIMLSDPYPLLFSPGLLIRLTLATVVGLPGLPELLVLPTPPRLLLVIRVLSVDLIVVVIFCMALSSLSKFGMRGEASWDGFLCFLWRSTSSPSFP